MTTLIEQYLGFALPQPATLMEAFLDLEARLRGARFHPTSPWWLATIERFCQSGKRQLVLRVGRRGGKSSTLCRIAVAEALYGAHEIPPGDIGIVGIVSVSIPEAKKRLRTVRAILDALSEPYKPLTEGSGVELVNRPIAFQTFAATLGGVVGGTWICGICDEVARWNDKETGVNPANEVLASLRPTMATQRNAKLFLSSSPLGLEDAHAKAFADGETQAQSVAAAPTWIANPTISEADTHVLEPNKRVRDREYGIQPQGAKTAVFREEDIQRAFELYRRLDVAATAPEVLVIDASRGTDAFAWGRMRWVWAGGRARLQLLECGETPAVAGGEDFTAAAVAHLAGIAKSHGITNVLADQYEAGALTTLFGQHGLTLWEHTWSSASKKIAIDHLERWLRDGLLLLCENGKLLTQLREYQERITRTGDLSYGGAGTHDDYVQVLMTCAMAIDASRLVMVTAPAPERLPSSSPEYWRARERAIEASLEERVRAAKKEREDDWS